MVATFQEYSLGASSTPQQIEAALKQALIDGGLMYDWYDRFEGTDGFVHAVLELVNDESKTYGRQYIWFAIGSGGDGVYIQFATGWNSGTHQPTGTTAWDYYEVPNLDSYSYDGYWTISTSTSAFKLQRFTSQDKGLTVIRSTNGGYAATIFKNIGEPPAWLDLNHACAFSFFCSDSDYWSPDRYSGVYWYMPFNLKRCWLQSNQNYDSWPQFADEHTGPVYSFNHTGSPWGGISLPFSTAALHPTMEADVKPIVTHLDPFPPLNLNFGADFGLVCTRDINLASGDTFTLESGEVWTVIESYGPTALRNSFVARTT